MSILAIQAPQAGSYAISRRVNLSRLIRVIEAVIGWYRQKMQERALEGLSMPELKDICYPTVGRGDLLDC